MSRVGGMTKMRDRFIILLQQFIVFEVRRNEMWHLAKRRGCAVSPEDPELINRMCVIIHRHGGQWRRETVERLDQLIRDEKWLLAERRGHDVPDDDEELVHNVEEIVNDYCRPPDGCVSRPIAGLPHLELFAVRRARAPESATASDLWARLTER